MEEKRCSTVVTLQGGSVHCGMPSWLVLGSWDFQRFASRVGYQEAMGRYRAYLDGFVDIQKNWWCGQCYQHCLLMNYGYWLGYPAVPLVGLEGGYGRWLSFARFAGSVAVENAVCCVKLSVA